MLLVVFMPNITTNHTITYTWSKHFGWNKGIQIPDAKQKTKLASSCFLYEGETDWYHP